MTLGPLGREIKASGLKGAVESLVSVPSRLKQLRASCQDHGQPPPLLSWMVPGRRGREGKDVGKGVGSLSLSLRLDGAKTPPWQFW